MRKMLLIVLVYSNVSGFLEAGEVFEQEEITVQVSADGENRYQERTGYDSSVIAELPEVVINSQGGSGGQQDISIRGSTFSGAGLSVEGLALNNAQTEHFNAELPFFLSMFSAPVVRSGLDQLLATEGFLVGTVDFRVRPVLSETRLGAGVGEYSSYWFRGQTGMSLYTNASQGELAAGIFGGLQHFNHVNYEDNNNRSKEIGGQMQWHAHDIQLNLLSGYKDKQFGARGYYGVNPQYDADEKLRDYLTIISLHRKNSQRPWSASVAYRKLDDDYKLYLPQSLYHNEHTTKTLSGQVGGSFHLYEERATVRWRMSGLEESIESSSLGDHRRARGALTCIPSWRYRSLELFAGVRQEVFEHEKPASLPQAGIEWLVNDFQLLRLSYSKNVRQPSYTELNYESPASLGNQGLGNQEADELSLDWNCEVEKLSIHAGMFVRRMHDTIDWIYPAADSSRWTAENIGTVKTYGSEADVGWHLNETVYMHLDAMMLDKQNDADFYSSRYALDYDRLCVNVEVVWQALPMFDVSASQMYRIKADNPLRNGGDDQWLGTLQLGYRLPCNQDIQLAVIINNLWNSQFQEFPNQDTAAGRRYYASVIAAF